MHDYMGLQGGDGLSRAESKKKRSVRLGMNTSKQMA